MGESRMHLEDGMQIGPLYVPSSPIMFFYSMLKMPHGGMRNQTPSLQAPSGCFAFMTFWTTSDSTLILVHHHHSLSLRLSHFGLPHVHNTWSNYRQASASDPAPVLVPDQALPPSSRISDCFARKKRSTGLCFGLSPSSSLYLSPVYFVYKVSNFGLLRIGNH